MGADCVTGETGWSTIRGYGSEDLQNPLEHDLRTLADERKHPVRPAELLQPASMPETNLAVARGVIRDYAGASPSRPMLPLSSKWRLSLEDDRM